MAEAGLARGRFFPSFFHWSSVCQRLAPRWTLGVSRLGGSGTVARGGGRYDGGVVATGGCVPPACSC